MNGRAKYIYAYGPDLDIIITVYNIYAKVSRVTYEYEINGDKYTNECFIRSFRFFDMSQIEYIYEKACREINKIEMAMQNVTDEMAAIFTD